MGDGRWEMGDGRWEMGDGRLSFFLAPSPYPLAPSPYPDVFNFDRFLGYLIKSAWKRSSNLEIMRYTYKRESVR